MILEEERKSVVEFGRKLIEAELTTGTGGNLSAFNRAEGLVAIKPSGVAYFEMTPADVVVIDLGGHVLDGNLKPSSETLFHLSLYKFRPDINAVVHTHQIYATTIACLNWELPAVHYLVGLAGNKVPLAAYATFGSDELSENILQAIGNYNACLLANHGLITVGGNMAAAFATAEEIELVSRLYYQAKCIGNPVILSDEEMKVVIKKYQSYGNL
jgi:L-fuculose-phosphate aldolase